MLAIQQPASARLPVFTADDPSLLVRYYDELTRSPARQDAPATGSFEPGFAFPELDARLRAFLAPATARYQVLASVGGISLRLLDLRRNPATQTTKTFASLLLVARAVEHIRRTREPLLLFSPSSGNKAVALRDAVERALRVGLVSPEELRVVTLTPELTTAKLRRSRLSDDPDLRRLNPVVVLGGTQPEAVKAMGAEFAAAYAGTAQTAGRLWATLRLGNYCQADMVRAFADYEFGAGASSSSRLIHAHAVSSAYGLLGYQTGLQRLRQHGLDVIQPGFLLVQHLATCDMVLHTLTGSFDRTNMPTYRRAGGAWTQDASPHFPQRTWSPVEALEHTFYTHEPVTAQEMSQLIGHHGGTGVVVSLLECMQRYGQCRELLAETDIALPEDPRMLREWSLVMALTGVLNAVDRGLLRDVDGVVVHASGSYGRGDYDMVPPEHLVHARTTADLLDAVRPTGPTRRP